MHPRTLRRDAGRPAQGGSRPPDFIQWWNGRQLARLRDSYADNPRPLVLMGDLNMEPARALRISGMRSLVSAATFPASAPRLQLDHVLLDGDLSQAQGRAVHLPLSDHCALVVDVRPTRGAGIA